jgi:hypothetical protein
LSTFQHPMPILSTPYCPYTSSLISLLNFHIVHTRGPIPKYLHFRRLFLQKVFLLSFISSTLRTPDPLAATSLKTPNIVFSLNLSSPKILMHLSCSLNLLSSLSGISHGKHTKLRRGPCRCRKLRKCFRSV